jgi:cytoskeleton protein RodZ
VVPFGAWLKRERERQGVSLEEISMSTKVGTRFLHALEDEHFEQLPGGIFNKAFVKAYARQVGIDEEEAIASYLEAAGETIVQSPEIAPNAREDTSPQRYSLGALSGRERINWRMGAALLVAAVFVLVFWKYHSSSREGKTSAQVSVTNAPERQNAPSQPQKPQIRPEQASRKDVAAAKNQSSRISIPTKSTTIPIAPGAELRQVSAAPGEFSLIIRAKSDCWLLVTADGKEVLQDTLAASAEKLVAARNQITVKAGNVGALELWFNGKKLPAQGDYEEVKTIAFNSNGVQSVPTKLAPAVEALP